jgi:uncharacterized SAM-binding protein YcdF (DUF218 family)
MRNTDKRKLPSKFLRLFVSFSLCLILWAIIAPFLAYFLVVEKPVEKVDAIWVLGGSSAYLERTQKAAELYRQGVSNKIFIIDDGVRGGWNDGEKRNLPFFEISKRELVANGVDESAIEIVKPNGDGTNYEATYFSGIEYNKIKSLILVTSPYHTRRALWTFQHFNPNIEFGVFSPKFNQETPSIYFWWLSVHGWERVAGEYLKFVYYWVFL